MNRRFLWVFLAIWGCWGMSAGPAFGQVEFTDPPEDAPEVQAEAAAKPAALVGAYGQLSKLELDGNKAFMGDEIREELANDLALQASCRPSAPLTDLVDHLEETLAEGYRHSGYLDAEVRAGLSSSGPRLAAEVVEGGRYAADNVQIEGVDAELSDTIHRRLTTVVKDIRPRKGIGFYRNRQPLAHQQIPDQEDSSITAKQPLWTVGKPVRGSNQRIQEIRQAVADELGIRGYPMAKFNVSLERSKTNAKLLVNVTDLGTAAQLDEIEIRGLERHSREEVLEFIGLKEGQAYGLAAITEAHDRLRQSCRFWSHNVAVLLPGPDAHDPYEGRYPTPGKTKLVVILVEYSRVPKLDEPFGEVDETLRRTGIWMSEFSKQNQWDLRCRVMQSQPTAEVPNFLAEFILSSQYGMLLHSKGLYLQDVVSTPWDFALFSTPEEQGMTDPRGTARWSVPASCCVRLEVSLHAGTKEVDEYRAGYRFAASLAKSEKGSVLFTLHADPVSFVDLAHRKGAEVEVTDNEIHIREARSQVVVDRFTGRLIKLVVFNVEGGNLELAPTLRSEGDFQSHVDRYQSLPNRYEEGRGLKSLLQWCQIANAQLSPGKPWISSSTLRLLEQVASLSEVGQIKESLVRAHDPSAKGDWFELPSRGSSATLFEYIPTNSLPSAADVLFVRETWPWTLVRELAFVYTSRKVYAQGAGEEFARVDERPDTGAMAYWTLCKFGYSSETVGAVGLTKFSDGSFEREVSMLTTPDTGMMKLLAAVVPVVQGLPEEDTDWLCGLAGEEVAPQLEEVTWLLRKLDASSDEALQQSLRVLLEGEIRERVEADLRAAASAAE